MTGRTPLVLALSMAGALALYGCSGGGDGPAPTPTPPPAPTPPPDPPPPPPPPDPLKPSAGLIQGDGEPVYAMSTADKIGKLARDAAVVFAPLTAGLDRSWDDPQSSKLSTTFHIEAIRSDGANGFHVTYANGDTETTVHFAPSDWSTDYGTYHKTIEGGHEYWLWSLTRGYGGTDGYTGNGRFRYLDIFHTTASLKDISPDPRGYFVFGARTEPTAMPDKGAATYTGELRAYTYDANDPSNDRRQSLYGELTLVANFDLGALTGGTLAIDEYPSGEARLRWSTSAFEITDGRIVDGQFTATLTGKDSDPNVDPMKSVMGYVGSVFGEFYGPNGEEIGGVWNATRDLPGTENDRVAIGSIAGKAQLGRDPAAISTGVDRVFSSTPNSVVAQAPNSLVGAIADDGAGGFRVTYTVDGVEKTAHLAANEFGVAPGLPWSYFEREGTEGRSMWYESGIRPRYNYLDVNGWVSLRYLDTDSSDIDSATHGYAVTGARTGAANMPAAGSATYSGEASAYIWQSSPDSASSRLTEQYRGALGLTADFAAGSVIGQIDGLSYRPDSRSSWSSADGAFAIGEGTIEGDTLSGSVSGLGHTGTVRGAFYGPAAAEVGGVMEGTGDGKLLTGWFAGSQQ